MWRGHIPANTQRRPSPSLIFWSSSSSVGSISSQPSGGGFLLRFTLGIASEEEGDRRGDGGLRTGARGKQEHKQLLELFLRRFPSAPHGDGGTGLCGDRERGEASPRGHRPAPGRALHTHPTPPPAPVTHFSSSAKGDEAARAPPR